MGVRAHIVQGRGVVVSWSLKGRVASRGTGGEVTNRPSPAASVFAVVAKAADPAFDASSPDGFFVFLSPDEARADIELLAHKGWIIGVRCAGTAHAIATGDTLIVFEVVEASEWVFVFVYF